MNLNINWKQHKWAIFYCLVSTIGALCYGYDTIYYTGIQGMKVFIHNYGYKKADGQYALTTSFLSVTASVIYVGEFCGALITAPINDRWGRRAVFFTASFCIICGAIVQVCSDGIYAVFCVGRVFIGLGIGQFTATCGLPRLHWRSCTRRDPWPSTHDVPVHAIVVSVHRRLHQPRDRRH